jgi:EAL domain-containing protein (putative c-di-GMP-specific phosphodiesterase class I)
MSLIEQRNRFLSFAFASADILVETDMEGTTSFAAGAAALLGEPSITNGGDEFAQRLDRTSRPVLKALILSLKPGKRVGPTRVTIGGREAKLCGWLLGDDHKIRWTLSFDAIDAPEEVSPENFANTAENAIAAGRENDASMGMSVLRLMDVDDIDHALGTNAATRLRKAIHASAMLIVGQGGVVKPVGTHRWALIHHRKAKLEDLTTEVSAILKENNLGEAKAVIESVADAPSLDPKVAVQAFLHAVNQAADSDVALDVTSLQEVANSMMEETTRRMNDIRTTIAGRVFEPFAQPIVLLETGAIHHYEMLLRLPGGKPVAESVEFAESTGLIQEIDMAMTEIAGNFLRDDYDRPALAVNLSGKSLAHPHFGQKFLRMLGDLKIDRKKLSFEITETAKISNTRTTNAVIQKIRERGHDVYLDDFGSGASGFGYLRDFPADVIKIDGSYVRRAEKSDRDMTIIKGMADLCRNLGAKTVAEMIETKSQAEQMKAIGITYGQGYYFGKPIPLKTLADPRSNTNHAA